MPDDPDNFSKVFFVVEQFRIAEVKSRSTLVTHNNSSGFCLTLPCFWRTQCAHLPPRQVADSDLMTFSHDFQKCGSACQFNVIRMSAKCKGIDFFS